MNAMRVVILGSGKGSNAEAILQAERAGQLGRARVVHIFSDKPEAGILALGARFGVPATFVDPAPFKTKLEGAGEERFIVAVRACAPDLVVLAGFMRVLKPGFLNAFAGKIINLHPSLLPLFPGLDGIGQALRAGATETGCTVHHVTIEVDGGEIIAQTRVPIAPGETLESLAEKVHAAEHKLLPAVIAQMSEKMSATAKPAVHEFKIEVQLGAVPQIEELLAEREEQRLMVLEDKPSVRAWLTGYFDSREQAQETWKAFAAVLEKDWIKGEPDVHELPDADWKDSYKAHFKASSFGPLHWVPVWERDTFRAPAGEKVLWLDPGMAFGTGNHETTRLVAERLVAFAAEKGTAARVIDAGCGSGILALSAALLGFREVSGFDNDPEAIRVSEENAALNQMSGRAEFFVGDLTSGWKRAPAGLVLANIQADVLVRFTRELLGAVAPGGWLVLSGILERELADVRAAFAAAAPDWRVDARVMGEWSDLLLARP
jgi:ribosomal protein L11 methyltransferase